MVPAPRNTTPTCCRREGASLAPEKKALLASCCATMSAAARRVLSGWVLCPGCGGLVPMQCTGGSDHVNANAWKRMRPNWRRCCFDCARRGAGFGLAAGRGASAAQPSPSAAGGGAARARLLQATSTRALCSLAVSCCTNVIELHISVQGPQQQAISRARRSPPGAHPAPRCSAP